MRSKQGMARQHPSVPCIHGKEVFTKSECYQTSDVKIPLGSISLYTEKEKKRKKRKRKEKKTTLEPQTALLIFFLTNECH
jgi:hypothetical protein